MIIRTKTRDPKPTDFSKQELVNNIDEGSLFYKSNLGVHKLFPTSTIAVTPNVVIPPTPAIWTETGNDIYYNTGKVGIGTTSPGALLHVSFDDGTQPSFGASTRLAVVQTTNNGGFNAMTVIGGNSTGASIYKFGDADDEQIGRLTYLHEHNRLDIVTNNSTAMTIDSSQNVGIGTTSPGEILELNGNLYLNTGNIKSNGDLDILTDNGAQHAEDKAFINLSGDGITGAVTTINGDLEIVSHHTINATNISGRDPSNFTDATDFFQVPTGIGHLTVNGDIHSKGMILAGSTVAGAFPTTAGWGSIGSTSWFYGMTFSVGSDRRFKKNINSMENSLAKILSLRGVTYEWKDKEHGTGIQHGFIAQEVQEIVPELVAPGLYDKLSVNYQGVIPILVEAIKNQQKQIDELKEKLK